MTKLYNIHKKSDKVPMDDAHLMLTLTSCWKINQTVVDVIDYLPYSGTVEEYIVAIKAAHVEDAEKYLEMLKEKKILCERPGILHRVWIFFKQPRLCLIKGRWLNFLHNKPIFEKIFSPYAMVITFAIMVAMLIVFYTSGVSVPNARLVGIWKWASIGGVLLGILLHELGHSLACAHFGLGMRPIGLSWYLIWPIAFTNVSGITILDRSKRLVINLAGMYFQSWAIMLMIVLTMVFKQPAFLAAMQILVYLIIYNLNPFIRSDFHWCYQDLFAGQEPSLTKKIVDGAFQVGYFFFTLWLVWRVGRGMYHSVMGYYHNVDQFHAMSLYSIVSVALLFYIQFLVLKGISMRVWNLIKKKPEVMPGTA